VGGGRRRQPTVQLVERATCAHRGERGGQPPAMRGGVVDVVGRHRVDPASGAEPHQGVIAGRVERVAVVPDLDQHVVPAERLDQAVELVGRCRWPALDQRIGHRALAAAGEDQPMAPVQARQPLQACTRRPLGPGELRRRDGSAQTGVTLRVTREDQQVLAGGIRVGRGRAGARQPQGELGAEHRAHAERPGGLREADHPVHAVAIGERERLQPEVDRLLDKLLRRRGAVQEARVGMTVQLRVGDRQRPQARASGRAPVGLRITAPDRGDVGAPAPGPWPHPASCQPSEFRPRNWRILPAHALMIEHQFEPGNDASMHISGRRRNRRTGILVNPRPSRISG
jgi:hypothetical protein